MDDDKKSFLERFQDSKPNSKSFNKKEDREFLSESKKGLKEDQSDIKQNIKEGNKSFRKAKSDIRIDKQLAPEMDPYMPSEREKMVSTMESEKNPYNQASNPDSYANWENERKHSISAAKLHNAQIEKDTSSINDVREEARKSKRKQNLSRIADIPLALYQLDATGNINWDNLPSQVIKNRRKEMYQPHIDKSNSIKASNDVFKKRQLEHQISILDDAFNSTDITPSQKAGLADKRAKAAADLNLTNERIGLVKEQNKATGAKSKADTRVSNARIADYLASAASKSEEGQPSSLSLLSKNVGSEALDFLYERAAKNIPKDKVPTQEMIETQADFLLNELIETDEEGNSYLKPNALQELKDLGLAKDEAAQLLEELDSLKGAKSTAIDEKPWIRREEPWQEKINEKYDPKINAKEQEVKSKQSQIKDTRSGAGLSVDQQASDDEKINSLL